MYEDPVKTLHRSNIMPETSSAGELTSDNLPNNRDFSSVWGLDSDKTSQIVPPTEQAIPNSLSQPHTLDIPKLSRPINTDIMQVITGFRGYEVNRHCNRHLLELFQHQMRRRDKPRTNIIATTVNTVAEYLCT